ncbi:MAG: hypothetical protein K0R10_1274 [Alphaproteobacteria bacterium]|jgi:hypothetical protein|nr:hypothetical protein [Alphaproteobacteria bacterium]
MLRRNVYPVIPNCFKVLNGTEIAGLLTKFG